MQISSVGLRNLSNNFKRTKINYANSIFNLNAASPVSFNENQNKQAKDHFSKLSFKANNNIYTLEWALKWNEEDRKKELDKQTKKAIKEMSFWKRNFTMEPEKLEKEAADKLKKEKIACDTLLLNQATIKNDLSTIDAKAKQNSIIQAQLDKQSAQLDKWKKASEISKAFQINQKANLGEQIAGYKSEKMIVRNTFIDEIAMERAGLEANVPNSILLYGLIGTGKTTFVNAVANESGCKLVEINPESDEFTKVVRDEMKEAKKRYVDTRQRTIILINEIDLHLENTIENRKNIAFMKSVLDNCSKTPNDDIANASAVTFFFTTNHPSLITNEILSRYEKLEKVIALEPASEESIKEIIKFYIKKFDPDGNYVNVEKLNLDDIAKEMGPNNEKGAYGNDAIKGIVKRAFDEFNRDTDEKYSFIEHLQNVINNSKRNISPNDYKNYQEEYKSIGAR